VAILPGINYHIPMSAWNGWYHVTGGTYGTWLRGDPRGWRDRKHREHVEGDYRHPPPPGKYDGLLEYVQSSMKHPPVKLPCDRRTIAGQAMVEKLVELGCEPISFSLDAVHYHILVRFPHAPARHLVGKAKKHAYHVLRTAGHAERLWAKRCRVEPIDDRAHQVNVHHYILEHRNVGAWTWSFREGVYWRQKKEEKEEEQADG
jgi:hypothetical protein